MTVDGLVADNFVADLLEENTIFFLFSFKFRSFFLSAVVFQS